MILRSDGKCIKGEEEFQGMALDASIHVAKGKVTDETIEQQLKSHAQDNTDLSKSERDKLEALFCYSNMLISFLITPKIHQKPDQYPM